MKHAAPLPVLMALCSFALVSCLEETAEVSDSAVAVGQTDQKPWRDWSHLSDKQLKEKLTPLQYKVTKKDGTERAFDNEYYDNKKAGLYVCLISGDPLFSSQHKYKSGTGWPSFYKPLFPERIEEVEDRSFFTVRTEVRAKRADSHLGHVFDDGPQPTGLRYCLNSAALRFIPVENLEEEGYGEFTDLFDGQ